MNSAIGDSRSANSVEKQRCEYSEDIPVLLKVGMNSATGDSRSANSVEKQKVNTVGFHQHI